MSDDKKITVDMINDLYDLIVSIKSRDDCRLLFEDLCTNKEVEQMAQRLLSARLLMDGCTYSEIMEKTDISSATLSRVSRCVQYGNGYKTFLSEK